MRAVGVQRADHGGSGQGEHSTGLGNGDPHASSGLAQQLVRLRSEFLSAQKCSGRSSVLHSSRSSSFPLWGDYRTSSQANSPTPTRSTTGHQPPSVAARCTVLLVRALACWHDREKPTRDGAHPVLNGVEPVDPALAAL